MITHTCSTTVSPESVFASAPTSASPASPAATSPSDAGDDQADAIAAHGGAPVRRCHEQRAEEQRERQADQQQREVPHALRHVLGGGELVRLDDVDLRGFGRQCCREAAADAELVGELGQEAFEVEHDLSTGRGHVRRCRRRGSAASVCGPGGWLPPMPAVRADARGARSRRARRPGAARRRRSRRADRAGVGAPRGSPPATSTFEYSSSTRKTATWSRITGSASISVLVCVQLSVLSTCRFSQMANSETKASRLATMTIATAIRCRAIPLSRRERGPHGNGAGRCAGGGRACLSAGQADGSSVSERNSSAAFTRLLTSSA